MMNDLTANRDRVKNPIRAEPMNARKIRSLAYRIDPKNLAVLPLPIIDFTAWSVILVSKSWIAFTMVSTSGIVLSTDMRH